MPNQIHSILVAEIERVSALSAALGDIEHGSTVGEARESMLRDIFRRLLPSRYQVYSGIIVDTAGRQTPQLDAIIVEQGILPPYLLPSQAAVVPVEAALAAIEIKSTIDQGAFDQLMRQQKAILELKPQFITKSEQQNLKVSVVSFLFAFTSKLKPQRLQQEASKISNLLSICTLDGYYYSKLNTGVDSKMMEPVTESFISFVSMLSTRLEQVREERPRDIPQVWHHYLTP
ncbi:MAG: hypothetical protein K8S55_07480 [Phycisphaerae bacterium]|nr:hypothetical protein [Phycisphaerae bacterium]